MTSFLEISFEDVKRKNNRRVFALPTSGTVNSSEPSMAEVHQAIRAEFEYYFKKMDINPALHSGLEATGSMAKTCSNAFSTIDFVTASSIPPPMSLPPSFQIPHINGKYPFQ